MCNFWEFNYLFLVISIDYALRVIADVENAAAAKAEIVDALKNVCLDLQYGAKIAEILNFSPVWAQYKDQHHDLFIPANETRAIAGWLF